MAEATMRWQRAARWLWFFMGFALASAHAAHEPSEVAFASLDGKTALKGYLFQPATPGPWPAVVMMHGRAGPYSAAAKGVYDATTLSLRHKQWGRFWAERGYLALHVDSFGPRGYPQGFPIGSYSRRPAEVDEQRVRPLDAYGALAWLRTRDDVIRQRIGLQGWSNGAMAALAILDRDAPGISSPDPDRGFRAALIFYPGCRVQLAKDYHPYAPAIMFIASNDEEVAPLPCSQMTERVKARGVNDFEMVWYDGATHSFDDPGKRRQSVPANREARSDSMVRAEQFFETRLKSAAP
jgi:carboxymethylenebutenolidase